MFDYFGVSGVSEFTVSFQKKQTRVRRPSHSYSLTLDIRDTHQSSVNNMTNILDASAEGMIFLRGTPKYLKRIGEELCRFGYLAVFSFFGPPAEGCVILCNAYASETL